MRRRWVEEDVGAAARKGAAAAVEEAAGDIMVEALFRGDG